MTKKSLKNIKIKMMMMKNYQMCALFLLCSPLMPRKLFPSLLALTPKIFFFLFYKFLPFFFVIFSYFTYNFCSNICNHFLFYFYFCIYAIMDDKRKDIYIIKSTVCYLKSNCYNLKRFLFFFFFAL